MSDNVAMPSFKEFRALSQEQRDKFIYDALVALMQENAELRRGAAVSEDQQQQQQQQQQAPEPAPAPAPITTTTTDITTVAAAPTATNTTTTTAEKRCYVCDEPGHVKRHCPQRVSRATPNYKGANVKIVHNHIYKGGGHGKAP